MPKWGGAGYSWWVKAVHTERLSIIEFVKLDEGCIANWKLLENIKIL